METLAHNQEILDTQAQIDALQQQLHDAVEASDVAFDLKKNAIFEARATALAALTASKDLPECFWAATLVGRLRVQAEAEAAFPHFLGPYDEALLTTYLTDLRVEYTARGHRISLRFAPNPYFQEEELWAEVWEVMGGAGKPPADDEAAAATTTTTKEEKAKEEEEEEEEAWEEEIHFSGITWNPGYGPESGEDDAESQDDAQEEGVHQKAVKEEGTHQKRAHESSGVDTLSSSGNHNNNKKEQGPSVLEVFSLMPPYPEEDSELCNDDDDEEALIEAVNEWEDEMEDRKLLLSTIVEAYHNPDVVWTSVENFKDLEMALKKVKTQ